MVQTIVHNYVGSVSLHLSDSYAIERHILEKGNWEPHLVAYFSALIKPGFVCVDVGANTGIHTLTMASFVGETGKVLAFEPSPEYLARLKNNIAINSNLADRIQYSQMGLSNEPGELKLFESGERPGNAYLAESMDETLWNRFGPDVFTVCRVSVLDEELMNSKVDLIKIDVEGMEAKVLQGALKTVNREKPILIYESLVRDFGFERVGAMNKLVVELGYYRFFLHPKLGKLVACYFPTLPEDVLAIHPARLLSAASIIHNAVRYTVDSPSTRALFGNDMFLTVIGLGSDEYAIAWSHGSDDSPQMAVTRDHGDGVLSFEQLWNGVLLQTRARVVSHESRGITECSEAVISIKSIHGEVSSVGKRLGGLLYERKPNPEEC